MENHEIKISWAITACNEGKELKTLLEAMFTRINPELDQIVILTDKGNTTKEVKDVVDAAEKVFTAKFRVDGTLETRTDFLPFIKSENELNKDFGSHKNVLGGLCQGEYIVYIDADEVPSELFFSTSFREILKKNPQVDLFHIPRINLVAGITDEHINRWGWKMNEKGYINFPDYQSRVVKNHIGIKWEGKVHEKLVGARIDAALPAEEVFCFYHIKNIDKQEFQNNFYEQI